MATGEPLNSSARIRRYETFETAVSDAFRADTFERYGHGCPMTEIREDFSFDEYRMFMMRNLDQLPPRISQERDMVESLLEDIRETRNALFHFRAEADEVDRDQLDMAHGYFTGVASTV